ncbi:MAG TPA: response regulator [Bryobacteraceae bacterium]|nr:response regulator [Bryobacteraceae bacterium]
MAYRVLVVDDSPAMRSFIRRILNLSGFAVSEFVEAANGLDALEILHHRSVDVVLTDINMPRMNGEELVRQLEQDHRLRMVPVVVVSGDSSEVRVKRLMEIGARGYIAKPFSPERMRMELDRVLGRRA